MSHASPTPVRPPAPPTEPSSDWSLALRSWAYARPHLPWYVIGLLAAPVSALLVIAQPWLLKVVIDEHIVPGDLEGVRTAALWYLAAIIASFFAEVVYSMAMSWGALKTISDLRRDVYSHTLSLSQRFFDHTPTGRLLTRATSDVESLGETLTAGAVTIVLDVLLVLGIITAMLNLNARLTLMLAFMAPPVLLLLEMVRRALRRLYAEVRESLSELNAFTAERLEGVRVVQLYSDEARTMNLLNKRIDRYRSATVRTNVWDALIYAVVDGVSSICVALMIWMGAGGGLGEGITAGLLVAFIEYLGKLFEPIREFSSKLAILQRASAALEKIFSLLDTTEQISAGNPMITEVGGTVEIRDLHFRYADDGDERDDVLRGVSLTMRPGEVVAVVGRTGSGKTTLGKLLVRAYDGYRGSITIGGVELSEIPPALTRSTVGMVRQDVQLFPADVRFNLTLGADISDDALWDVVKLMCAEDAVLKLGGLDGRVAHRGANLSVGEGQLLSFARTMAHDPAIVILDEATASVDTMTEGRIQAATDAVLSRKTTLVIAHRLSTIINADRIAVMDAGKVVEIGTHTELLALGGVYASLFHQQFEESETTPALSSS